MKFIVFPLAFLVVFAILSMFGLGAGLTATQNMYTQGDASQGFFDSTDHLVAYANRTSAGETGVIKTVQTPGGQGPWNNALIWDNTTSGGTQYNIYDTTGTRMIQAHETQFSILTTGGLLAIVTFGVIGGGIGVVAMTFLGGSDTGASAILKGTLYMTIWGIFSGLAYPLIGAASIFGGIFYFIITGVYLVGVVNQIGSPGDEGL